MFPSSTSQTLSNCHGRHSSSYSTPHHPSQHPTSLQQHTQPFIDNNQHIPIEPYCLVSLKFKSVTGPNHWRVWWCAAWSTSLSLLLVHFSLPAPGPLLSPSAWSTSLSLRLVHFSLPAPGPASSGSRLFEVGCVRHPAGAVERHSDAHGGHHEGHRVDQAALTLHLDLT